MCCSDRLNPQPRAVVERRKSPVVKSCMAKAYRSHTVFNRPSEFALLGFSLPYLLLLPQEPQQDFPFYSHKYNHKLEYRSAPLNYF